MRPGVLGARFQAGQSLRALQLLDSMADRQLMPDAVSYNAAMNACAQRGECASGRFRLLELVRSRFQAYFA